MLKEILESDIVIVGAGPIGCKTAELLGKNNLDIIVLEKNNEIGKYSTCTGLVSHRIFDLSEVSKKIVVNKIQKARFYSTKNNFIELKHKTPVYVIDRNKFDKELGEKAKKYSKIKLSTSFEDYMIDENIVRVKTNKEIIKTKMIIGADGPNSLVAGRAKINLPDNLLVGVQQTIKSDYISDTVELWLKQSPDFFAWVVPENEEWARIGIAAKNNVSEYFKKFVEMRIGKKIKYKNQISGLIRTGIIENSVADNVILVGDAASQVKPFSGGGLIYGLICSKIAADACIKSIEKKKYDSLFLKENYDKVWKEKLYWPMKKGVWLSKFINNLPEPILDFAVRSSNIIKPFLEDLDMDLMSDNSSY